MPYNGARHRGTEGSVDAVHYSMVIEWSDEDQAFLVSFPAWAGYIAQPVTHGDTYEEAARKGQEVLENLMATARHEGEPLPTPKIHVAS
jgi:antitoxin HicB